MSAEICGPGFDSFFSSTIIPLVAYATIVTSILIALSFMVGRATANPKLTLWSKTEVVQLVISVFSVFTLSIIINSFCIVDIGEVAVMFGLPSPGSNSIFGAAQDYLHESTLYAHNAMTVVRYHLEAYTVMAYLNAFACDFKTGSIGWGCLFGYSGENMQPFGGHGASMAALNIFFNGSIMAFFTSLNFLFILLFVYKGFVFLFLPMGVFLRAMPYMRSFGSLLIALAMSFLIVYPLMLSVFWLMRNIVVDASNGFVPPSSPALTNYMDEDVFPDEEGAGSAGQSAAAAFVGDSAVSDTYFPNDPNIVGAIMFAANAFVAAVFLPTTALIAAIASVSYLARLYGEEINLTSITRLM
ncbi:hypothetical protein KKE92_06470 [Candidatus Micrarchaeota archaeon]|nr:hypothetical protein [Candidatus Micrarchaeota archaeon]MBU1682277.1 hypothetical protein [Candidatus Micrarchaeota archaeon]